jgi:uncharacterized membrane protein YcaP (DUF421 family)
VIEWLLRHTLPFLLMVLMVRWVLRPRFGKRGVVEVLVINAIGDMASHAAFEEGHPLLSGIGAVGLWVIYGAVLAWLVYRSRHVGGFVGYFPYTETVVQDGAVDAAAMSRLRMSRRELDFELRKQGFSDVSQVTSAWVEPDGALSVRPAQSTTAEIRRMAEEVQALRAELAALRSDWRGERGTAPTAD